MIDIDKQENLNAVLLDVLDGDVDLMELFQIYDKLDLDKIQSALNLILDNPNLNTEEKIELLNNSWRVNYKRKPPSMQEFLTPKYLGEGTAESLYPRVVRTLSEFSDSTQPYRNAVLYPYISWGKSYWSVLWNMFTTTNLALMYDAKKYLGLAPATTLCQMFCSFNLSKSAEVLLAPLMNILESSEFFEQVRTKKDIIRKQKEFEHDKNVDKLYWTTSSIKGTSSLQFSNGIQYKLASTPAKLLGLSIVTATFSELAFFTDYGKSPEYIMRFYNDAKSRIYSRLKGNYFGRVILDSSPNNLESVVDQYCCFEAKKDEKNYIIAGSHWEWCPEDYDDINDRFPVYRGGQGKPPTILNSTEGYDESDIIHVPRQLYQLFHDDLRKALKDLAGIPQGNLDKLFYDYDKIDECFVGNMKSIDFCLKADARMSPHELIWNQIKDTLFVKSGFGYKFYYKPDIPRVFHIDQSVSGDMSAIAFVHVERKNTGKLLDLEHDVMYIVDFVIPIHPFGGRINLDAIKEFILDVYTKGGMPLLMGSYDTYQSESALQFLERAELKLEHISVDETTDPYLFLAQQIEQGNLKLGRNIFVKNNLKSLRVTQRPRTKSLKIDHTMGDSPTIGSTNWDWETSLLGINAKDCSDAICGAVENARRTLATDGHNLLQVWDEKRIILSSDDIKINTDNLIKKLGFSYN